MQKRIYISLPTEITRSELFQRLTKDKCNLTKIDFKSLAELTKNYSSADISNVCRNALLLPFRRIVRDFDKSNKENHNLQSSNDSTLPPLSSRHDRMEKLKQRFTKDTSLSRVNLSHFIDALKKTKPSNENISHKYEEWNEKYGAI